jgi:uncharacterized membrane protein
MLHRESTIVGAWLKPFSEPIPDLMSTEVPPLASSASEDRTVAILSYITLIGFVVAVVLFSTGKKTALGAYHLRQTLGLLVASVVLWMGAVVLAFIPIIGPLTAMVIWAGLFVRWLMGLIAAINGQQKPMPVLGDNFQKWFAGAFN